MSEKFCLKWNDFHSNVSKSFGLFRNEDYLHDVTLVSDDHRQVSAHKLVLSASSEYFKNVLKNSNKPNSHPLLCLDGVNSDDLRNILDYIYNGEIQICQENLDRFLSIAQRLKLDGLIGNDEGDQQNDFPENEIKLKEEESAVEEPEAIIPNSGNRKSQYIDNYTSKNKEVAMSVVDKVMVSHSSSSEDITEVESTVTQYIEKCADGGNKCTLCGKVEKRYLSHLKNHIETHLEGLSFPCQLCGKTFRSRNALSIHKTRYHSIHGYHR